MYLTFQEYYGITECVQLESNEFLNLEYQARKEIDARTQGRVACMKKVPESIKQLMARLVDINRRYFSFGKSEQIVKSISNDGVTETYQDFFDLKDLEKEKTKLINTYLSNEKDDRGVPLLYLGVR